MPSPSQCNCLYGGQAIEIAVSRISMIAVSSVRLLLIYEISLLLKIGTQYFKLIFNPSIKRTSRSKENEDEKDQFTKRR